MHPLEYLTAVFLAAGCVVSIASGVGLLRMPDFFTRLHPAGKNDTLGQTLILFGLVIAAGFSLISLKLLLIWFFLLISAPSATHAIARAAWVDGRHPWEKGDPELHLAPPTEQPGKTPKRAGS